MQKKTTDTLTMTSNDRHIITQTDLTTGLIRYERQCNLTRTQSADQKENRKKPRFEFLKISASAHLAHPAFPLHKAATQKAGRPKSSQRFYRINCVLCTYEIAYHRRRT